MNDSDPGASIGIRGDSVVHTLLRGRGAHFERRDAAAEREALSRLAQELADTPASLQQTIADVVRELCGADSVVVAVHEVGAHGEAVYWTATSGGLAGQLGSRFPLEVCPCGVTIRSDAPVLFEKLGPEFTSVHAAGVPVGEVLGIPWRVQGRLGGALAAMLPDGSSAHFDADDLVLLQLCAGFAGAAQRATECAAGEGELERQLEERLRPVLESRETLQREIEESRAAERALREHKALVDATLTIGTVGVLYFDLGGTIRDVNGAFERMTGYGVEELRAMEHWKALTPPEFWDLTNRAGRDLLDRGVTMPYTKQMFRKDGSRWWGLFAPARISGSGKGARCVMFVIDVTENKQTEADLADSEERFRALVEGFGQAVWETDAQGRVVQPSVSWSAFTGQPLDAALGMGWIDAVHPDDRGYALREWRAVVGKRRMLNVEFRVQVAAGGWRWTNARAAPLFNTDGSLRKWVGMHIDVDERRRTQALLTESERRHRLLFEAMDEGFLLADVQFDPDGRARSLAYAEANPAAVRMVDIHYVAPGQLKVLPEHEPCWLEACVQVVRSGASARAQCFSAALQSWYDFFVYPVGGQHSPRVAILFHDITIRKRAEDALRESEARFRALADASPALVYQFDLEGNLIYLNQRCMAETSSAAGEGGAWRSIPRPEDMDAYLGTVFEGIRKDNSYTQRIHTMVRGGNWHWFESHAAPWYSGEGEHRGYVGIALDITSAVQAEEALKDADRRKDEFLATLAHELRNPLAPISNAVQLMRRPDGRRQSDRVVEMVGRQVNQIVRLVDDLMEVSSIARGKIDLKLERLPFAEIVHSAVETSQLMIDRAGHQLSVALPEDALVLDADRLRLTQVFANLLNNAAKYTDGGGRIWLDVRRDGAQLVATVRDTGIGIPAADLPRVFDMFAQAHRSIGRGQGGLGIGLTMVRSLVEMHRGTVEARSAGTGQGSEFTVRLPLASVGDDGRAVDPPRQARPNAPFAGQRILVVDDNRDAADTLGLLLESDGAEVRVVYDGRAALATAEAFAPTSVLLDIGMPGMDGFEVARRLRQEERHKGLRIVALTGWGQDSDRRHTRNRGFSSHLTKPVSVEDLQRVLG